MSTNAVQLGSSMLSIANTISGSLVNFDFDSDDDVISVSTQEIPCRDINRARLRSMLTIKFGSEAYDMHVSELSEATLQASLLFSYCHPAHFKGKKTTSVNTFSLISNNR